MKDRNKLTTNKRNHEDIYSKIYTSTNKWIYTSTNKWINITTKVETR